MSNEQLAKQAAEKMWDESSVVPTHHNIGIIVSTYAPVFAVVREMRDEIEEHPCPCREHPETNEYEECDRCKAITSANRVLGETK